MYNVRNGQDLAVFLADPRREDFDAHSGNLVRLMQRTEKFLKEFTTDA